MPFELVGEPINGPTRISAQPRSSTLPTVTTAIETRTSCIREIEVTNKSLLVEQADKYCKGAQDSHSCRRSSMTSRRDTTRCRHRRSPRYHHHSKNTCKHTGELYKTQVEKLQYYKNTWRTVTYCTSRNRVRDRKQELKMYLQHDGRSNNHAGRHYQTTSRDTAQCRSHVPKSDVESF